MGSLLSNQVPTGQGELIRVETLPLLVEASPEFEEAKAMLQQMLESAGSLANSITNDEDYNRGIQMLKGVKAFLINIEEGAEPTKKRINAAKNRLMELLHELDVPAKKLQAGLAQETGRYLLWKEEQVRRENERLAREAEAKRQAEQRKVDMDALMSEIGSALNEADAAVGRGQAETATEIRNGVNRLSKALQTSAKASLIVNPIAEATGIRQLVALALQHEQARIAAAEAKAAGDKKAAAAILRASAKLEAPVVEEVRSEQVQVVPTMARQPDLDHAKGSYVKKVWRVKEIYSARAVPREYCIPSESLLNEYAKRLGSKPMVPGVEFEETIATKGVR